MAREPDAERTEARGRRDGKMITAIEGCETKSSRGGCHANEQASKQASSLAGWLPGWLAGFDRSRWNGLRYAVPFEIGFLKSAVLLLQLAHGTRRFIERDDGKRKRKIAMDRSKLPSVVVVVSGGEKAGQRKAGAFPTFCPSGCLSVSMLVVSAPPPIAARSRALLSVVLRGISPDDRATYAACLCWPASLASGLMGGRDWGDDVLGDSDFSFDGMYLCRTQT
ncbi:hypothetical protein IWX48DRAFT_642248 [Phyllosticta citricarpa]